jgi:hypothetical protein
MGIQEPPKQVTVYIDESNIIRFWDNFEFQEMLVKELKEMGITVKNKNEPKVLFSMCKESLCG